MSMVWAMTIALLHGTSAPVGVRTVEASSCEVVRLNVALGITTQVVFESAPSTLLYADQQHFKITTSEDAKRSLAIIPSVSDSEIQGLFQSGSGRTQAAGERELARALDDLFRTNLIVFFKGGNQMMFQLRFVPKNSADYIVKVSQRFPTECAL